MTRIRASRPDDSERLFEIWQRSVITSHGFLSLEDLRGISRIVRDEYLPEAALEVVVDESDRPLGFMGMTGSNVDSLFIDPACTGCGLGTALIEHARAAGSELSVDVNEQNAEAVVFYRRRGFEVVGRSPLDDGGRPYPILHMQQTTPRP